MSDPSSFVAENNASREPLAAVVNSLTDAYPSQVLEAGWTVSVILAYLAFWVYRVLVLLRKWKQEGIGPSPVDVVNEATRILCLAIPPRRPVGRRSA